MTSVASDLTELVASLEGVWLNSDNVKEAYVSHGRNVIRLRQKGDCWKTPADFADFVNILRDDRVNGRIQWGGKGRFVLDVREWKGTQAHVVHWADAFGGPRGWHWHRAPIDVAATIEALVATPSFRWQQEQQHQQRHATFYGSTCFSYGATAPAPVPVPPRTVTSVTGSSSSSSSKGQETPQVVLPPTSASASTSASSSSSSSSSWKSGGSTGENQLLEETLRKSLDQSAAVSKSKGGPPPHRTPPQPAPGLPSQYSMQELMQYQRYLDEQQATLQQQLLYARYTMGTSAAQYYSCSGGSYGYGTTSGAGYRACPY